MRSKAAYIFVLAAAFLWGNIGVFVRALTEAGFTTSQLIAFRSWVSAAIMAVWLLLTDRSLLRIRFRDWWMFAGTGIVSFLLFNFCYMLSLRLVSLSTAAILLYTAPIFVAVLSVWIFREKFTARKAVSLSMAFLGCMFVSGLSESGAQSPTGVLFGLLSGFFYALYSIFGKVALKRYGSLTLTTYTFIFASAGIVPFCDYAGLAGIQWSPSLIGLVLAFAGGTGAAAYLLYTKGLERLTPTTAAVVAILEPVVAAIAGVVFFHETLGWAGFVGIALVVSAILILSWPGRAESTAPKS